MKVSFKALAFVSLFSLVALIGLPKDARACYAPLAGMICTGAAVLSLVPTLVGFIPGSHNQEQFCDYGTSSSCCAAPSSIGPAVPNNCTTYQQSTAVCPGGQTLFCPGANVPASTQYQTWARPVGGVGLASTFAFAIAATAIFSMQN